MVEYVTISDPNSSSRHRVVTVLHPSDGAGQASSSPRAQQSLINQPLMQGQLFMDDDTDAAPQVGHQVLILPFATCIVHNEYFMLG